MENNKNQISLDSIDFDEVAKMPVKYMVNEDVLFVIDGSAKKGSLLEADKVYQIEEPRLLYLVEGEVEVYFNFQEWHLKQGSIVMLETDTLIEIKKVGRDVRFVIIVLRHFFEHIEETVLRVSAQEFNRLLRLAYITWDLLNVKPYRRNTVLQLLSVMISDIQYIKANENEQIKKEETTRNQQVFAEFKRLVRKHCKHERSVAFYAEKLHLTPHYLSAVIKKASGKSVMYWVNRITVQEIKLLLKTANAMGCEVAEQLNFPSASAFSRFFKRETGMSPRAYRESVQSHKRDKSEN